jgi:hypothetical protein
MTNVTGDPGTWETARELGKQLTFPVGPYEARVPTADEMNAVLPYFMDRMSRFVTDKYFCDNAELTFAHILGINVPRFGFPDSSGFNNNGRHSNGYGRDWEGFDKNGLDHLGYNKEGRDQRGYDKEGFGEDGYNLYGRDREGFDKKGRDPDGRTRAEQVDTLIGTWSDDFAAAIAAHVAERLTTEPPAPTPAEKATKKAATAKKATPKKVAARKAVPAKRAAISKTVVKAIAM